jgi:BirA family biotin operon repressor/biotin-[acetyl-CoA-carboxylase] ligase
VENDILNLLKKENDDFITLHSLACSLNTDKDTIDRYLRKLKQKGYRIQFIPYRGIKLISIPDRPTAYEIGHNLNTEIIGSHIFYYEQIDSTNDEAKQLAKSLADEGIVVIAESQTKGRGRMHRKWSSPKGGLYLSVVLRPKKNLQEQAKYYLVSSVACALGIRKATGINCLIKWPNDILVNNKKVAGILTESSIKESKVDFLILGIGINVNSLPSAFRKNATSLSLLKNRQYSIIEIAKDVLRSLDSCYLKYKKEGLDFFINEWKNLSTNLGIRVKITYNGKEVEGTAIGIDQKSGALLLRKDNGFIKPLLNVDSLTINRR